MKKLYLTLVAAAVAFSAMAFDSGKDCKPATNRSNSRARARLTE